jgi:hypothetical protein
MWKLKGYTNDEIAARPGRVRLTIDCGLRAIRRI